MTIKDEPIAIFAGSGLMPKILIESCEKRNQRFIIFTLKNQKYEIDYSSYNPIAVEYGEVSKFLRIIKEHNIKNLIFVGGVTKPNFSKIKADKKTALLVAKILANKVLGDDSVLSTVVKFFKKEGLKVIAINDMIDCVLDKKGVLTSKKPTNYELEEIAFGVKVLKTTSKFDIGQSLLVAQKQIIALEAVEGTDAMIKRCKDLGVEYRDEAILVKVKKSRQSKKVDLPTIGVDTIINCSESGIKGLAIEAKATLIVRKEEVIKKANELGLFIVVI